MRDGTPRHTKRRNEVVKRRAITPFCDRTFAEISEIKSIRGENKKNYLIKFSTSFSLFLILKSFDLYPEFRSQISSANDSITEA